VESLTAGMPLVVFLIIGTVAVAASILVVAMRNPVHSALFLLLTFLCVAVLFVLKQAEFVAAVQVLVYAGGIMVLFLFVVMLINVRHLPEERILSQFWKGGLAVGLAVFVLFVAMVRPGAYGREVPDKSALTNVKERVLAPSRRQPGKLAYRTITVRNSNSEAVGMSLYRDYLVPFEVASIFLLVAMIGAIVIGKRELSASEEETQPGFILDKTETEQEVKEKLSA
jgi:NADH-quinone oxidoreductase subunit J